MVCGRRGGVVGEAEGVCGREMVEVFLSVGCKQYTAPRTRIRTKRDGGPMNEIVEVA